jgi:hypothetical protein
MRNGDTGWRIRLAYPARAAAQHHSQPNVAEKQRKTPAGSGDSMRMLLVLLAIVLAAAPFAAMAASPEGGDKALLRLIPKEAIASSIRASTRSSVLSSPAAGHAPFLGNEEGGLGLDFAPHPESRRGSPSSCRGDKTLCYDPSTGHIVYKPIRNFMPDIPGLQRENISLNRHRIVFKYSF